MPPYKRPTIAVLGSLNTDFRWLVPRLPSPGETLTALDFSQGPGGKGANQAVACKRLSTLRNPNTSSDPSSNRQEDVESGDGDVDVRLLGLLGDDPLGASVLSSLERDGIDTDGVRRVPGAKTGVADIVVEKGSGENRIVLFAGANGLAEELEGRSGDIGDGVDVLVLQLEIPVAVVERAVTAARGKGITTILNPAPAVPLSDTLLAQLDHLILNETEAAIISSDPNLGTALDAGMDPQRYASELASPFCASLVAKGVGTVVITLGKRGICATTRQRVQARQPPILVPARPVDSVLDTTAAGDTFVGAYAAAVARERERERRRTASVSSADDGDDDDDDAERERGRQGKWFQEALEFANRAAALTVQRAGSLESIPWGWEV